MSAASGEDSDDCVGTVFDCYQVSPGKSVFVFIVLGLFFFYCGLFVCCTVGLKSMGILTTLICGKAKTHAMDDGTHIKSSMCCPKFIVRFQCGNNIDTLLLIRNTFYVIMFGYFVLVGFSFAFTKPLIELGVRSNVAYMLMGIVYGTSILVCFFYGSRYILCQPFYKGSDDPSILASIQDNDTTNTSDVEVTITGEDDDSLTMISGSEQYDIEWDGTENYRKEEPGSNDTFVEKYP